ncbi:MAG TPA: RNA 2',3'-cyclic phosphodiesterase [Bacillales bacterium]|nr:RNA 2',3'-cyclic phosphodiesterase [Bacillales bacterium]
MAESMPHFFIAVPLPDPVRKVLHREAEQLRGRVPYKQWPHPEDYHITLAFLGGAGFHKINELKKTVGLAVKDCDPSELTLNGLGTFGKKDQPRVLWAGVSADQKLFDLQNQVYEACVSVGFELDKRPYKPHITLAKKWKTNEKLDRGILNEVTVEPLSWEVNGIVLYQIHPRRIPKYQPLKILPLGVD